MWISWKMYFSVHFSPCVPPVVSVNRTSMLKSPNYRGIVRDGCYITQPFPRPGDVITSAQNHVSSIHSVIQKQALSSSESLFSQPDAFSTCLQCWDAEAHFYYWLRSASLARFLSSASLLFLFFFKARAQKDKDRRKDREKKSKKTFEKSVGGVFVAFRLDS